MWKRELCRRTSYNTRDWEKIAEAKMMRAGGAEIGEAPAEKSRGLFSANDWQRKACRNVDWARSECNVCNTLKHAKLEKRTGYGGSFNKRENVDYTEREESDGEYDEFGYKKKKYRGKADGPAYILKEVEDKAFEGEDEDEGLSEYKLDEDEDDADLSKYNLDASEEDRDEKESNRRTCSRSQSSHSQSLCSSSPSTSGSRSKSHSRNSSNSQSRSRSSSRYHRSSSSPRKRSYSSSSSSPERHRKRSHSRSSSGDQKKIHKITVT